MGPFDKPVRRDTTANSRTEILHRLALVAYIASLLLTPILGLAALAQRDSALLAGGFGCIIAFVGLHVTRRFWKGAPRAAARSAGATSPIPATMASPGGQVAGSEAPMPRRPHIVILNAALAGDAGNTARLLTQARVLLAPVAEVRLITLAADEGVFEKVRQTLADADGFVIGTGTHWDSWSSVLQKFLEDATDAEGTTLWLGKPAACVVTEHSVGGKSVLSRLQGVLVTLGCTLPPMSGLVLSQAAQVATQLDPDAAHDFWCADDLAVVCHNLLEAVDGTHHWRAWPVDRKDFRSRWIKI